MTIDGLKAEASGRATAQTSGLPWADRLESDTPARFVERQYARVFAWFVWSGASRELAADLTQDAFAGFWASSHKTRVRDPEAWLLRIARNVWRRACRDAARRRRHEPRGARPELVLPTDAGADAREALVRAALREVAEPYREALLLRYWFDLTTQQIAIAQQAPTTLVRWRLHRGAALLRTALHARGVLNR